MDYSKGICWLDDTRIPFVDDGLKEHIDKYGDGYGGNGNSIFNLHNKTKIYGDTKGRFTPNLLCCDDMLNDGGISKAGKYKGQGSKDGGIWSKSTGKPAGMEYGDKGSNSRYYNLDIWFNQLLNKLS